MRTRRSAAPLPGTAALLGLLLALACGGPEPATPSGREMYVTYCASCHGIDGRGDGPVAPALVVPPTDLTRLEARGKFDEGEIMRVIDGRREVNGHGTRAMPVWGAVFVTELDTLRYTEYTTLLLTRDLMEYLRTIQEPEP